MSLALDVSRVEQVLLMDGWHRVATASFEQAEGLVALSHGHLVRVHRLAARAPEPPPPNPSVSAQRLSGAA